MDTHPLTPARPPITLGSLTIDPPLFLAPMAGLTHSALRRLLGELGGVGAYYTEMLSARALTTEDPETSPFLKRTAVERPLIYQLLVGEAMEIDEAVRIVEGLGADGVDLNFGCPAPFIRKRGGGSKLREDVRASSAIIGAARRATGLPLSVKIRIGETLDAGELQSFCRMAEGEGADILHVHARLRAEPYGRKPRWPWVAYAKEAVSIPVTANGSVTDPASARACLDQSTADGVMIGRAAARTPWVFAEVAGALFGGRGIRAPLDLATIHGRFVELVVASFPPERRLGRIKEFTHYFSENYAFGHTLRSAVQSSHTVEEASEAAAAFFSRNPKTVGSAP